MFLQNKYTRYYTQIVEHRQSNPANSCVEIHHILPKSLGGSDEKTNLVALTSREHFIVHRLLVKMTIGQAKRSMIWALHRMTFSNSRYVINSRQYQSLRITFVEMLKASEHYSDPEWCREISERVSIDWQQNTERRRKASERLKQTWREGKLTAEQARKNGQHGLCGILNHKTKAIEYKGKTYYGWRELREATGVTKALYRKYYLNGLDPEPRIGTDGPVPRKENR